MDKTSQSIEAPENYEQLYRKFTFRYRFRQAAYCFCLGVYPKMPCPGLFRLSGKRIGFGLRPDHQRNHRSEYREFSSAAVSIKRGNQESTSNHKVVPISASMGRFWGISGTIRPLRGGK